MQSCNWSSFWQLTTLKTLRSRPEDLELSKLLPLTLMLFSGVVFILGPLTAVLLALVMITRKKNGNILEYLDKTEEKCFEKIFEEREHIGFMNGLDYWYTRKNQTHCRPQYELQSLTGVGSAGGNIGICLRAPCNLHAFNHTCMI